MGRKKGRIKVPDGYISTREAAKMLGIARSTVYRYIDWGILTGDKHPITNLRRINKASVLALSEKYGMNCQEEIELPGNSNSQQKKDTSGQGAKNDTKRLSPHCG